MDITYALVGTILSLLTGFLSFIVAYQRQKELKKKAPTLQDKISSLTESLKNSLSVISEIQSEIENRSKIVSKLQDDVERYENLKQLSKPQVEAIAQTIRGEITGESKKSLWRNAIITFVVALIFFFLGFWLRGA